MFFEINNAVWERFLNTVFLGGALQECVIVIKNNQAHIEAIDLSNCLYVSSLIDIEAEDTKIGINDLSVLYKFISFYDKETTKAEIKDGQLILKRNKYGKIKLPIIEPELIPTKVEDENVKDKLLSQTNMEIELDEPTVQNLLSYIELLKINSIRIEVNKRNVSIKNGEYETNQFDIPINSALNKEEFSIEVVSSFFISIMKILVFKDQTPKLMLGKDAPVVINQNDNIVWVLSPAGE